MWCGMVGGWWMDLSAAGRGQEREMEGGREKEEERKGGRKRKGGREGG